MIGGEGGQNQHIRYNQQLQPVEITRPHGHKTLLEYDAQGRLVKQSDGKGRVTTITDAAGGTTAYRYNLDGNWKTPPIPTAAASITTMTKQAV
uniref:RHS repeat domain-containing protein n=1 Tax=Neisseria zoodegmatis TaxID=326523 RepID=UPI0035A66760